MKAILYNIGILIAGAALIVGVSFGAFELHSHFWPKYEGLRYDVHKESQAYRDGMVRRLRNLQVQYQSGSPEQKQTLRSMIIHESADFPKENLPTDLNQFINQMKQ